MFMPKAVVRRILCRITPLALFFGTLFPAAAEQIFQRTYQASAYVTILSVPIFSRSHVGYGWAREGKRVGSGSNTVELEFLSGSIPERAGGLNRFGYIQESVEENGTAAIRAQYFGLITANREESLHDAKAALNTGSQSEVPYVAASARIEDGRAHCSVRHLLLPAPSKSATADLMHVVKASFETASRNTLDADKNFSVPTPNTFLYSLRQLMLSPDTTSRSEFVYSAKTYILSTAKHRDAKVEGEMRHRGLATENAPVLRLNGIIENNALHERTEFALWYQKDAATTLPLRFEFRPKSYLKLVFDAVGEWEPAPAQAPHINETGLSFR